MKATLLTIKSYVVRGFDQRHLVVGQILFSLCLSWIYALCAQMILPIYPVVITVLPLPIYLMIYTFGKSGAYGFVLYILQGIFGAPFFAHGRSGFAVIAGPSGGYLMGMAIVAVLLSALLTWYKKSWKRALLLFLFSEVIILGLGVAQLSFFVSAQALWITGLYPFIFGEVLKVMLATMFVAYRAKAL